jgi:hypothetical protein
MFVLTLFTNLTHLSYSFISYEGDIVFLNKFTLILSNDEMTKI